MLLSGARRFSALARTGVGIFGAIDAGLGRFVAPEKFQRPGVIGNEHAFGLRIIEDDGLFFGRAVRGGFDAGETVFADVVHRVPEDLYAQRPFLTLPSLARRHGGKLGCYGEALGLGTWPTPCWAAATHRITIQPVLKSVMGYVLYVWCSEPPALPMRIHQVLPFGRFSRQDNRMHRMFSASCRLREPTIGVSHEIGPSRKWAVQTRTGLRRRGGGSTRGDCAVEFEEVVT